MTIFTDLRDLVISSELESPDVVRITTIINSLETAYTALKEYIESAGFDLDEQGTRKYYSEPIDYSKPYDIVILPSGAGKNEAIKNLGR